MARARTMLAMWGNNVVVSRQIETRQMDRMDAMLALVKTGFGLKPGGEDKDEK